MLSRLSDLDRAFGMMDDLQRRMSSLFEGYDGARLSPSSATGSWPPVNLYDVGDSMVVETLVPGLSENDITITGNEEVMTLSGERKSDRPEGYAVHRQERGAVRFSRSFSFPCRVDMERTTASVKDGVLTIKLAKAAEAKPRQIAVKGQ